MLSRKQQWRRVKCRRRTSRTKAVDEVPEGKVPPTAEKEDANSDDEVTSKRTVTSPYSSFESVQSALEGREECHTATSGVPASYPRVKGVTFEPRVQVYLVTHKSELDAR